MASSRCSIYAFASAILVFCTALLFLSCRDESRQMNDHEGKIIESPYGLNSADGLLMKSREYLLAGNRDQMRTSLIEASLLFPSDDRSMSLLDKTKERSEIALNDVDVSKLRYLLDSNRALMDGRMEARHGHFADAAARYDEAMKHIVKGDEISILASSIDAARQREAGRVRSQIEPQIVKLSIMLEGISKLNTAEALKQLQEACEGSEQLSKSAGDDAEAKLLNDFIRLKTHEISKRMLEAARAEEALFGCGKAIPSYERVMVHFEKYDRYAAEEAKGLIERCR